MVKTIKYILKRIIIGVGIAIILMLLKGGLIGDVYAVTPTVVNPTKFHFLNSNSSTVYDRDLTIATYDETVYYTYTFTNTLTRTFMSYDFNNNSLSTNTLYTASFVLYTSIPTIYEEPFRVAIHNGQKYYSCFSEGASGKTGDLASNNQVNSNTDTNSTTTVFCPNIVFTSNTNFSVYTWGRSYSGNTESWVGITRVTFVPDSTSTELQSIESSIQDTNDTLNDSTVDNNSISSTIQSGSSQIASNNAITQLLTLPITLFQNILNSLDGNCAHFYLGNLFNYPLTLPCINLKRLLGSTLYGIIDVLISGLFILSFRKKMVDIFNNMTSLKDRGNELE